jgi:regulator of cell morphogenesis and NO signaling
MFTEASTVADIVSRSPATAVLFEKYQIDYCCGGHASLEASCQAKGITAAALLKEIQTLQTQEKQDEKEHDWLHEESIDTVIDFILDTYHAPLKTELVSLQALVAKVARVHGERHPELSDMEAIVTALAMELTQHMQKEETILFPLMRQIYQKWLDDSAPMPGHACGTVQNPIRVMEQEHDEAGRALRQLRDLSHEYQLPEDACASYKALYTRLEKLEQDLHRHVHLENYVLHPLAKKMEGDIQE